MQADGCVAEMCGFGVCAGAAVEEFFSGFVCKWNGLVGQF